MKSTYLRHSLLTLAAITALATTSTLADQYTNQIPGDYVFKLIANHLDHGSNTLNEVFPSMPGGTILMKWDCIAQNWGSDVHTFIEGYGWDVNDTLAPGDGAMMTSGGGSFNWIFTGTPHVPVLPVEFPCGVGKKSILSCQTVAVGTFENITGLSPREGDQFMTWNLPMQDWETNTFSGGVWSPATPSVPIGEAAMILRAVQTVNLTWAASGNQLTLSWPADQIGYELEVQTNALNAGINTNWHGVRGSTSTNQLVLPIDPANGCVFYRLRYTP